MTLTLDRRRLLLAGGLTAAGGLVAACGSASSAADPPSPTASTGPLDSAARTALDAAFDAGLAATGVAGVAGYVWIGGEDWSRIAGVADLASAQPFDPGAHVRIASITKSFTATAVLRLVDDGRLHLDDTVEQYVPGLPNGTTITVFDLLGMRSGLYDFTADATFNADFDADPTMPWSDQRTLAIIKAHPVDFAPGQKVVYADSNYAVLGMIIEKVTGRRPGEVITDSVIARLSLPATSYPTGTTIPSPHPTGYVPDVVDASGPFDNVGRPPRVVDELNPAVPGTAGAMISRAADLRVWAEELTTGSLLSAQSQQARMQAVRRLDGQQVNLGYGLGIMTLNEFVGHDGAIYGFSSVALRRPQTDTTIVLVANESTNSTTPTLTIAVGMIAALYPDQVR